MKLVLLQLLSIFSIFSAYAAFRPPTSVEQANIALFGASGKEHLREALNALTKNDLKNVEIHLKKALQNISNLTVRNRIEQARDVILALQFGEKSQEEKKQDLVAIERFINASILGLD